MTLEQAAAYLGFILSAGAVYKAFFAPQIEIVRLQEQLKAVSDRVERLETR